MAEKIPQYVKDVYMLLARLEIVAEKETPKGVLHLLRNPETYMTVEEFYITFKLSNSTAAYNDLHYLEKSGILECKEKFLVKKDPVNDVMWELPGYRLKQDLDKDFASLLKSELELRLKSLEI